MLKDIGFEPFHYKFRPKCFNEVVGQKLVCYSIKKIIIKKRIHFAYLFSGPKGIGKTTLARLFAKTINCSDQKNGEPCLLCNFCKMFQNKLCMDFFEIDGASYSNLDNIKTFLTNIEFSPISCKYKIYLIDEVHMLSKYSFNYLLKILEEPPKHVKFILVTTDYTKILDTILSRCIHYQLNIISQNEIYKKLYFIVKYEKIIFDTNCLNMIAYKANGSVRDALNILEQLISISGNAKQILILNKMFGTIEIKKLIYLLYLLKKKNQNQISFFLKWLNKYNINYFNLIHDFFNLVQKIFFYKKINFLERDDEILKFKIFFSQLSLDFIDFIYKKILFGIQCSKYFLNFKMCFEMIILSCL